jgi:hypothetical protein
VIIGLLLLALKSFHGSGNLTAHISSLCDDTKICLEWLPYMLIDLLAVPVACWWCVLVEYTCPASVPYDSRMCACNIRSESTKKRIVADILSQCSDDSLHMSIMLLVYSHAARAIWTKCWYAIASINSSVNCYHQHQNYPAYWYVDIIAAVRRQWMRISYNSPYKCRTQCWTLPREIMGL